MILQSEFTCSNLTIETLEQGVKYVLLYVFIVNFEHISHFAPFSVFSIVNFEQVNAGWVCPFGILLRNLLLK